MRLIRIKQVMNMTGISRAYIYMMAQKGEFPTPVKLSERSSAWIESEVYEWIDERIALRDNQKSHGDYI